MKDIPGDLAKQVLSFCRALRSAGLPLGPAEGRGALQALPALDLGDRHEVFVALRSLLCQQPRHRQTFAALFAAYFGAGALAQELPADQGLERRPGDSSAPGHLLGWRREQAPAEQEPQAVAGRSQESAERRDFSRLSPAEAEAVARLVSALARRLASRPGRRWRVGVRGEAIALRQSLRAAIGAGGELADLRRRRRRPRRVRVVVACDVSGSMLIYSRFLLHLVWALQRHLAGLESFTFATRLSRVSGAFKTRGWQQSLAQSRTGYGGGTRIGACLDELSVAHAALLSRRSVLVIISDGWDAGEPPVLRRALQRLRGQVGRIVWLNPLAGAPGYQPRVAGMAAALPFLDVLAPCHNLESLLRLPALLGLGR